MFIPAIIENFKNKRKNKIKDAICNNNQLDEHTSEARCVKHSILVPVNLCELTILKHYLTNNINTSFKSYHRPLC